jgi:drug/metabolite transporter (DMT)-like permease
MFLVAALFLLAVVAATALNFLIAKARLNLTPIACSGARLLMSAAVLFLVGTLLGVAWNSRSITQLLAYSLVGLLTMALPHALIFTCLRPGKDGRRLANPTLVAIIEASIVGFILVYLVVASPTIAWLQVMLGGISLVGIFFFFDNTYSGSSRLGFILLLIAAISTSIGIILLDYLGGAKGELSDNLRQSVERLFYGTLCSGLATFAFVCIVKLFANEEVKSSVARIRALESFIWLLILAVFGTGLTWLALFMLVELRHPLLAASVAVAVPVTTEIVNWMMDWEGIKSRRQLVGAIIVMLALTALMLTSIQARFGERPQPAETASAVDGVTTARSRSERDRVWCEMLKFQNAVAATDPQNECPYNLCIYFSRTSSRGFSPLVYVTRGCTVEAGVIHEVLLCDTRERSELHSVEYGVFYHVPLETCHGPVILQNWQRTVRPRLVSQNLHLAQYSRVLA